MISEYRTLWKRLTGNVRVRRVKHWFKRDAYVLQVEEEEQYEEYEPCGSLMTREHNRKYWRDAFPGDLDVTSFGDTGKQGKSLEWFSFHRLKPERLKRWTSPFWSK